MTVLSRPRPPQLVVALELARAWCAGHIIDAAPALGHAVRVALFLGRHVTNAPAEWVAAVLLHDAAYFAPSEVDLDTVVANQVGAETARIVRALQLEHAALSASPTPGFDCSDRPTMHASAADKIVILGSVLGRAKRFTDPAGYWATRAAFITRVPYFRAFHTSAAPSLPTPMADELRALIGVAEHATHDRSGTGSATSPDEGRA